MIRYRFEWDEQKNQTNQKSHGLSFAQASQAFYDPMHIIIEDVAHSKNEPRYFLIGFDGAGVATVRFTLRDEHIRIIGAGYWRKGKKLYEGRK
ncbi:MAG: BrnT family toxin [Defluviitaleaceae bacterium]|nr:BrnT family toxin [Defluviitaleaceae bacterium]MCL2239646.1 BrnT family toxin [Defluviitaleaceae bacterium]